MTKHAEQVHQLLMLYRPTSQFLKMFVAPEVQRRVDRGQLTPAQLPVQVSLLRVVWQQNGPPLVEINEEVKLLTQVKSKVEKHFAPGQAVTLDDIDPDECFLLPPEVEGKPASFYLSASLYLSIFTMFDFTHNAPALPGAPAESVRPMRYPIADILRVLQETKTIRPKETFALLAAWDWPPGREYYPSILLGYTSGKLIPGSAEFSEAVAVRYGADHWEVWCDFWEQTKVFPSRLLYVRDAARKFVAGDYIGAVRVAAPEFEGLMREHLRQSGITPSHNQRRCMRQFRDLVLSRPFMMFSVSLLDLILGFIERDLMRDTDDVADPALQVSRHGVAHGIFGGFETRDIALKYLILLDALAFVVFHDRFVDGKL